MAILIYLIKTILISGLLFSYYSLFLKNRPFHSFNRYFLLSIPMLSFLLPAFAFEFPGIRESKCSFVPYSAARGKSGKIGRSSNRLCGSTQPDWVFLAVSTLDTIHFNFIVLLSAFI